MGRRSRAAVGAALVGAAAVVVTAVLAFPSGPARGVAPAQQDLPVTLEGRVFNVCMPDVATLTAEVEAARTGTAAQGVESLTFSTEGSGRSLKATVEAPGFWRVDAGPTGVTLESESGAPDRSQAPALTPAALTIAGRLYACLSKYRFVDQTTPQASSSQLVQWYKYDTAVLWPCLAAHGLRVSEQPSRADFSDAFRAQAVDPFRGVKVTRRTLPQLVAAVQQCPVRPSYLR